MVTKLDRSPSSYLYGSFSQDCIVLSTRLTDTEHPQVPRPVHLERQLLFDGKKVALMLTMTSVSKTYNRSIRVFFKAF